jgi:hypothetical protein
MAKYEFSTPKGSVKKASLAAHAESYWLGSLYPKQVLIPGTVVNDLLVFDFVRQVQMVSGFERLTQSGAEALLRIVREQIGFLENDSLLQTLTSTVLGNVSVEYFDADGEVKSRNLDTDMIVNIVRQIVKSATEQGISAAILREALMSGLSSYSVEGAQVNWSDIYSCLTKFQELYAKITLTTPSAELAPELADFFYTNNAARFTYAMRRSSALNDAPAIPARLSWVVDNTLQAVQGHPFVHQEEVVKGLHYTLRANDDFKDDKNFETFLVGYLSLFRGFIGFETTGGDVTIQPMELAHQLVTSLIQLIPGLPIELRNEADTDWFLQRWFPQMWMVCVIERITSGAPSLSASRATSLMDFRKYKNDEFTYSLNEFIEIMGHMTDAYLDVTDLAKQLAFGDRLLFSSTHFEKREVYKKFLSDLLKPYEATQVPMTHPRFIKEGSILFQHSKAIQLVDMKPVLAYSDVVLKNSIMVDMESGQRKEWRMTPRQSGSILNIETPLKPSIYLQLVTEYKPLYYTFVESASMLQDYDLFRVRLGIVEFEELTKSPFLQLFLDSGELVYIMNATELARMYNIPESIAQTLFKKRGMYWMRRDNKQVLFSSKSVFYDEVVIPGNRYLSSWVSIHPTFVTLDTEIGRDKVGGSLTLDMPLDNAINKAAPKKSAYRTTEEVEVEALDPYAIDGDDSIKDKSPDLKQEGPLDSIKEKAQADLVSDEEGKGKPRTAAPIKEVKDKIKGRARTKGQRPS